MANVSYFSHSDSCFRDADHPFSRAESSHLASLQSHHPRDCDSTPTDTVMSLRARIYFDELPSPELKTQAQIIHNGLAAHPDLFPNLPISLPDFQAQINDFNIKLQERQSGATAAVAALRQAHVALAQTLRTLGQHMNIVALTHPNWVERIGFPTYATRRPPDYTPPPAPQTLVLRHGTLSGTLKARFHPSRRRSVNEVQICLGNPDREENWTRACYASSSKADLQNLPPGALVWVRVRTLGLKGLFGPWSDPAQIRAI